MEKLFVQGLEVKGVEINTDGHKQQVTTLKSGNATVKLNWDESFSNATVEYENKVPGTVHKDGSHEPVNTQTGTFDNLKAFQTAFANRTFLLNGRKQNV